MRSVSSPRRAPSPLVALASLVLGCAGASPGPAQAPSAPTPAAATATSPGAAAKPAATPPSSEPVATARGEECGALGCRAFESAEAAFARVLDENPRVLAIGEAHAQKGTEHLISSTRRFTETLLPALKGKASFLAVELLLPNGQCKKVEKKVAEQQRPVTAPQAESNQNEFVTLGKRAKQLGIVPDLLRPSCAELQKITEAGAGDIGVMLETIARLTREMVDRELARNEQSKSPAFVVTYGGALHNDLSPRQGRETWSYGPELAQRTGGRYLELDIIVPEYIKDTESWTSLPWVAHYDRDKLGDKAVLFNPAPGSWVLVFPVTRAPAQ